MRVLLALGGNAMTAADGSATPDAQRAAIAAAMESVAGLIAAGHEVVITHGNGPQVGNLLVKNELAAAVVPPVSLDWCGAQTQATIGFTILNALERQPGRRSARPARCAAIVTRTRVDEDDPGFARPTKPVGRFLPVRAGQAAHRARAAVGGPRREGLAPHGRLPRARRGARDRHADDAAGRRLRRRGGRRRRHPGRARHRQGGVRGVEAVIDKDLTAAVLARSVEADVLVIATDVDHAIIGYGTPEAEAVRTVTLEQMRDIAAAGHFASGSMGPKVEAAMRFVESGGRAIGHHRTGAHREGHHR